MQREMHVFRSKVYHQLREHFTSRGYVEVETPLLVRCPGAEAYLRYFSTSWQDGQGHQWDRYLRSSPELHMKQLLAGGEFKKIFQIGKCFRNGGEYSDWHHPEFTLLEFYETDVTFESFMDATSELLAELFRACGSNPLATFTRITVCEAFSQFAGLELFDDDPDLALKAQGICPAVNSNDDFATAFFKILLDVIEPRLREMQSVILYDYPPSQAALAQVENGIAKRFEVYLAGIEICNAFLECIDKEDNQARFVEIARIRKENQFAAISPDPYFNAALKKGIPSCCGNAVGIDRLLALLAGANNLDAVIQFRRQLHN